MHIRMELLYSTAFRKAGRNGSQEQPQIHNWAKTMDFFYSSYISFSCHSLLVSDVASLTLLLREANVQGHSADDETEQRRLLQQGPLLGDATLVKDVSHRHILSLIASCPGGGATQVCERGDRRISKINGANLKESFEKKTGYGLFLAAYIYACVRAGEVDR